MVGARIMRCDGTREKASGQDDDVFGGVQALGEFGIRYWGAWPQIESSRGHVEVQYRREDFLHRGELGTVALAVLDHMLFIAPGGRAGRLHVRGHGAAMVGAIEQKLPEYGGIARHEA